MKGVWLLVLYFYNVSMLRMEMEFFTKYCDFGKPRTCFQACLLKWNRSIHRSIPYTGQTSIGQATLAMSFHPKP